MADGFFPTLVSATRDANSQSNVIYTGVSDGTDLLAVNADGSINVTVTNASVNVAVTSVVPGTGATNLGKAEDAAHASGDVGVMALVVRNDANTSLVSADGDYAPLQVDANGSLKVNITAQTGATQYAEDTAAVSGDVGNVALVVRQDTLSSSVSADGDYAWLKIDSIGRLWVNVNNTVTVTATDLDIRDLTSASDSVSVLQATRANLNANATIQVGGTDVANGNPVPVSDAGGSLTVDGTVAVSSVAGNVTVVQPTGTNLHVVVDSGAITVSATDLDIRDLTLAADAVRVSANTTANSATNPIFVKEVDAVVSNEVNSYDTAAAVAGNSTSNHNYTVTGTTFLLRSVIFSSSGKGKVEVQTGPVGSLATKAVAFTNETVSTIQLNFNPPIEVPVASTGTVRLIRTNRQNQSQDLYSTILGNDVP